MAENPFAKFKPTVASPVAGGNPFAKFKKPVQPQMRAVRPQDMGPQTVNIADKTDRGGPNAAQQMLGNQYSPFLQGATLGASDEILSGMNSLTDSAYNAVTGNGPTSISENYNQRKAQADAERAAYERDNPKTAISSEIAGGLMSGGVGAKFIKGGIGIGGKILRSSLVGGGVGGAQGFAGTNGNIDDRSKGAALGAALGGTLGAVLPPVFATSKALLKGVTAPIRSLAKPKEFAARKVAEAMSRDGMSLDRVKNRLISNSAIKGDLAVADVAGSNTADSLRAASNVPSKARQGLIQQLEYRQANQLKRLQGDIGAAFGAPEAFHAATEKLVTSRKAAAKPMFDHAFSTPTPYTVDLENVLKRPLMGQLVERARIAAANRGEKFKNIFVEIGQDGSVSARRVIDTEGLHRVKMTIDEMINSLKKGQPTGLDNVNMRDLTILKKDLLSAIHNQPYKQALSRYAGDSAMVTALDDGFEQGLKMDPEQIAKHLSSLTVAEQKLWRLGFSRSISDSLRDTGRNGTNRADILSAPKFIQRMEAALPDKAARRDLLQAIKLEQRMYRTRNAVQGNSTTAKQLAQGQEAGVDAENTKDVLVAAKDLASGNIFGAAIKFLGRAKNTATGLRPEVADEMIRLLTTRRPADVAAARRLIQHQQQVLTRKGGRTELLDGLRAISAGLLSGRVGEAVASPP